MTGTGVGFVVAGAAAGLVAAFALRPLLPAPAVAALLAVAGAAIGWGGMLLQPTRSVFQTVFAVVALAVLVPFHVRVVLGPFGPRGKNWSPGAGR